MSNPSGLWAPTALRFWSKVRVAQNGCYLWVGATTSNGYGQIRVAGRARLAHRLAYTIFVGAIPRRLAVCHRCDNPKCVRPSHLFVAAQAENMRDMARKGRRVGLYTGSAVGTSKLRESDVVKIRRAAKAYRWGLYTVLARTFGISTRQVTAIVRREQWKAI